MQSILQLLFIFLLSSPILLSGQQVPLYLQYRNQLSVLNPAGLFIEDIRENFNTNVGVSYQYQFSGIEERPHNVLAYYKQIWNNQRVLTGFYLVQDKAGAISSTGVYGNFAYLFGDRFHTFSIGISGGAVQKRIELSEIATYRRNSSDMEAANKISPDFSVGFSYLYKEKTYVSFQIPQLFAPKYKFNSQSGDEEVSLLSNRHYLFTIGKYFDTPRGGTTFVEPSFLFAYVKGADPKVDVNVRYKIIDVFWFGLGVSSVKTLHVEAGIVLGEDSKLKIGFARKMLLGNQLLKLGSSCDLNIYYAWEK